MAYTVGGGATSSLANAMTASQTTMQVASGAAFPSTNGFRVKVEYEIVRVTAGAGGSTWTVTRGIDGTAAVAHSAGVPTPIVQRVDVNACGTAPCTTLVPTTTVTGADGRHVPDGSLRDLERGQELERRDGPLGEADHDRRSRPGLALPSLGACGVVVRPGDRLSGSSA